LWLSDLKGKLRRACTWVGEIGALKISAKHGKNLKIAVFFNKAVCTHSHTKFKLVGAGLDISASGYGQVARFCEHGNETKWSSLKFSEFPN
jgi:hypothetical protein